MADKEKRLRKLLDKMSMRGKLKSVATLEEAHFVLVNDREKSYKYDIYQKVGYQQLLADGHTFPEDKVQFLVHKNPRNRQHLLQNLMSSKCKLVFFVK